jgi:hypothetical protein
MTDGCGNGEGSGGGSDVVSYNSGKSGDVDRTVVPVVMAVCVKRARLISESPPLAISMLCSYFVCYKLL